jgi:hypothetical protein
MSKYSSFKEHQLITENWRRYLKEESTLPGGIEVTPKIKARWARWIEVLAQNLDASGGALLPDLPDLLNQLIYDAESAEGFAQFLGLDAELAPYIQRYKDTSLRLGSSKPYGARYYKAGKGYHADSPEAVQPDDYWNVDPQPGDGFEDLRANPPPL